MKGLVLREFIDFVDNKFGAQTLNNIFAATEVRAHTVFESEKEYDERLLFKMAEVLHRATAIPESDIVRIFGKHLFARLVVNYQSLLPAATSSFDFMRQVEPLAESQIQELDPGSHLQLEYTALDSNRMVMHYQSREGFADLTEGLLKGCVEHFGEKVAFEKEEAGEDGGNAVRFLMTRQV